LHLSAFAVKENYIHPDCFCLCLLSMNFRSNF